MKVRQTFTCGKDAITIRYFFNNDNVWDSLTEIDRKLKYEEDELPLPVIEVSSDQFNKIIWHSKLR